MIFFSAMPVICLFSSSVLCRGNRLGRCFTGGSSPVSMSCFRMRVRPKSALCCAKMLLYSRNRFLRVIRCGSVRSLLLSLYNCCTCSGTVSSSSGSARVVHTRAASSHSCFTTSLIVLGLPRGVLLSTVPQSVVSVRSLRTPTVVPR